MKIFIVSNISHKYPNYLSFRSLNKQSIRNHNKCWEEKLKKLSNPKNRITLYHHQSNVMEKNMFQKFIHQ